MKCDKNQLYPIEWAKFENLPIKKQKKKFCSKMGKNEKVGRTRWAKFRSLDYSPKNYLFLSISYPSE